LSVLQFTASDYHFGIFNFSLGHIYRIQKTMYID